MYLADISIINAGDILLSSQDQPVSRVVRKFTKSDYSHAALYVGGSSYIHSDRKGVHSGNLQRWIFTELTHLKVLRLAAPSDSLIQHAIDFSRQQIGMQYSIKEAIRTKIEPNTTRPANSNRQFCSRLVAMAYSSAGIEIVENPKFCSPADIEASPLLLEVPSPLRRARPEEIRFADSESPLEVQLKITNSVLDKFREISSEDIQQYEQAFRFLIQNPQYDSRFTEIVESSGYLDLWKMEIGRNPWRYDYDLFLQLPIQSHQRDEIVKSELEMANELIERYSRQKNEMVGLRKKYNLHFIDIHVELYHQLVTMHEQQRRVALQAAE